jgi:tetratricopeptide (TPR) repeat protein
METVIPQGLMLCYLYAHADRPFCEVLDNHLAPLKRQGWIRTWSNRAIEAEQSWEWEIHQQISQADIVVVLVSCDFLASDSCSHVAMTEVIQRHDLGQAVVVPVVVRPVDWSLTPFHHIQVLPMNGKAVSLWPNRDQAFVHIVQGLKRLIEHRRSGSVPTGIQTLSYGPLWTVPYRQNRFFTGRTQLLERLSSAFMSWKAPTIPVVVLSGLGGIGKTQVVLEYAYRSLEHYQAIFWVNASSQETMIAGMVMIAETLGFSSAKELEPQHCLLLVKRWLEQHHEWLLILDALADVALVAEALPLRSAGHVLVTTHLRISQTVAQVLEVRPLSEAEAVTLLLRRSGLLSEGHLPCRISSEEVAAARRLCHVLDGLPLALDQAGAYIEETGCSVVEYERRYQHQQLALLSLRGETAVDHPASVVTTWSLSFMHLDLCDLCAADLLRACAFLAPEVIPQAVFLKGAVPLGPHLANILADEMLFDAAISTLHQFSLVRRDPQTQTISLHRLVQAVLRSLMPLDQQALWAERVIQALCLAFPRRDTPEWARCAFYLPHVSFCEELLVRYHLRIPMMGAVLYRVGRFFHEHAQYQQAEKSYHRARLLCQSVPVLAEADGLPHILESLGWLALGQRQFVDANALLHQAYDLKKQVYGDDHAETAITLHILGRVAHAQQYFEVAERFYQEALRIKKRTFGEEHAEIATTVLSLGWLMYDQKQYTMAYRFYQQAFRVRLKVLGTEHVGTAVVLHLLARLAHQQQQDQEAETLFLQALALKKRVLCADHPSIAITLDALAQFYQEQKRFREAETQYGEALRIREYVLGEMHLLTADTLHHLACCYQEQGQFHQAEELLERALTIREKTCGPDHPTTAISWHQYARLYTALQRWEQAEDMYQRTLAIRERAFEWNHPAVQSVVQGYARFLRLVHRDEEAQVLEQCGEKRDETSSSCSVKGRVYG